MASLQNRFHRFSQTLHQLRSQCSMTFFAALLIGLLGLGVRAALVLLAGNKQLSPLSGVGDQIRYLTLADSIFQGKGFTYADQPTALRPPLYPLLLSGFHIVFGDHYFLAVRIIQCLIGFVIAYVTFRIGSGLFGYEAGAMAGAIALALPTLVFIATELQTEDLAAFLTILFLFYPLRESQKKKSGPEWFGMGITSGLATLIRFNCAILPPIGALALLWIRRSLKGALIVSLIAGLLLAPWIVRNLVVFQGKVVFSSHGGINLLEGVLTPDGRAQRGEGEPLRAAVGWQHTDIELNDPHRLMFPSEDQLDRQARIAAFSAWRNLTWMARLALLSDKIATFWLSKDQLMETSSFPSTQRKLRSIGVFLYWIVLGLAVVGWWHLFSKARTVALLILFYAMTVTLAHLPFVMNTRLRIPFIDPLLCVLAGGGFCFLLQNHVWRSQTKAA